MHGLSFRHLTSSNLRSVQLEDIPQTREQARENKSCWKNSTLKCTCAEDRTLPPLVHIGHQQAHDTKKNMIIWRPFFSLFFVVFKFGEVEKGQLKKRKR